MILTFHRQIWVLRSAACYNSTRRLYKERKDIEKDEDEAEAPCLDLGHRGSGCEVVHHASHHHVRICIRPDWCNLTASQSARRPRLIKTSAYHHEDEPVRVVIAVCNILDAQNTQNVRCSLKACARRDDPAVWLSVDKHLDEVGNGYDAK